jgi:hypothetical protein
MDLKQVLEWIIANQSDRDAMDRINRLTYPFTSKFQNKLIEGADEQRVVNFFGVLAQRCNTVEDFRDMLPDMVVERMGPHEITGIPRLREAGYAFVPLPTKMKLYQDGTDIMFHYLVNELVF